MVEFRKKPVVIEARQFDGSWASAKELLPWINDGKATWKSQPTLGVIVIPTLEGDHIASAGDWIIRGVKGEFYPCKPDIFEATYELADTTDPRDSTIATLRAENERLRAALAEARAKVAELRIALRPFADLAQTKIVADATTFKPPALLELRRVGWTFPGYCAPVAAEAILAARAALGETPDGR